MELKGKAALVTGAAQGIGKAIAISLAREGADVIISDVNLEKAEETAKEISAMGVKALALKANVADFAEVEGMIDKAIGEFKKIDILVNNAGITRDNLVVMMKEVVLYLDFDT